MALFKNLSMLSNHWALKITSFPTMSTNSKRHYGLKQAPRVWYECLKEFLLKQGFEIGIRHHFLRDHETKGDIKIRHVSTKKQLADIFTKPLDESRFCALCSELNILDSRNMV